MQTDTMEKYSIPEMEIISLEMSVVTVVSENDPQESENFDDVFGGKWS